MSLQRHGPADVADAATPEDALADPSPVKRGEVVEYIAPPKYLANIPIITDPEQIMVATIERTLAATTPEQLLSDPDSGSLRDLVGQIITVTGVLGIMPSKYANTPYYLVFLAILGDETVPSTLSTGSPYAASRIATLCARGWAPRRVRVLELESASNPGQSSLWVVDAGPVVEASTEEAF